MGSVPLPKAHFPVALSLQPKCPRLHDGGRYFCCCLAKGKMGWEEEVAGYLGFPYCNILSHYPTSYHQPHPLSSSLKHLQSHHTFVSRCLLPTFQAIVSFFQFHHCSSFRNSLQFQILQSYCFLFARTLMDYMYLSLLMFLNIWGREKWLEFSLPF